MDDCTERASKEKLLKKSIRRSLRHRVAQSYRITGVVWEARSGRVSERHGWGQQGITKGKK